MCAASKLERISDKSALIVLPIEFDSLALILYEKFVLDFVVIFNGDNACVHIYEFLFFECSPTKLIIVILQFLF